MEKLSANSIRHIIIADFSKNDLVEENKTQKLQKLAIFEGDFEEHWTFSGKEPEWTERKLSWHKFPFEKTYYLTYIFFWKPII